MRPAIELGKPLPEIDSYRRDAIARSFWRASYRVGRDYLDSYDARGAEILVRHEREKADSYARRKRFTKARNHCGPIIRRYNDFVFRREAQMPEGAGALYEQLVADADGHGTPLTTFMRRALIKAQIERESYLIPDTTAPADDIERSVAQATAMGVRPVIRLIGADSVPWIGETDGVLTSVLVLMVADDGGRVARLYDDDFYQDFSLKEVVNGNRTDWTVTGIGDEHAHPYGACPVVRLRPQFDLTDDNPGESQISPLAESQQMIANLLAYLYEEIGNVTFTQLVASGVSSDLVKDVMIGNNRLICLPNPAAKFDAIGADPAQAATICAAIEDEQRELYRQAGISIGDPLKAGNAESGVAKAFKFNDLAANLSALADAVEDAHNACMKRVCIGNGEGYPGDAKYPDDFDMPDYAEEMTTLIATVSTTTLPGVIREVAIKTFADRNLSLNDEQEKKLDDQLAKLDELADTANSTIPFPPASRTAGANARMGAENT